MKKELDKSLLDYNGEIPEKFTLPEERIPPVHNQHIGTSDYRCVAYATTGIMRIMWKLYSGKDVDFSEAYVYGKYRRAVNRIGKAMIINDLMPGVINGGAVPQEAMPDLKKPGEAYDYVKANPELDNIAKPYAKMFEGYINLKDKTRLKTFENIKKALLKYQLPIYGEYVGHAIIFVGWNDDVLYYRDCDGTKWLKTLPYKKIKEGIVFIMADQNKNIFPFTDVPKTHWAHKAIKSCYDLGIMKGVNESKFQPNKNFSRAEAAQMIMNLVQVEGITVKLENSSMSYTDVTQSHWAYEAIKFCHRAGIMRGLSAFTFAPNNTLTRAEAAQLITNLMKKINIKTSTINNTIPFNDVSKEHWAYEAVRYCYNTDVMKGTSGNTFEPNKFLTRAEAAQLMENVIQKL